MQKKITKKNIEMRKFTVVVISVLLFFAMLLGVAVSMPKTAKAEIESLNDITKMTDEEQAEIDADILEKWGEPTEQQLVKLEDGFTKDIIGTSGDKWFYLDSDISGSMSGYLEYTSGHLRIVLNGYSISGEFKIKANASTAQVSIFDRIPGKSGTGYNYKSDATRYYKYNSSTGAYSTYSTSVPSGTNVTDMPTFKNDTYIKVTGSAFAPNSANSGIVDIRMNGYVGIVNAYNINFVGCIGDYLIMAEGSGTTNLYQCNILGNNAGRYLVGMYNDGILKLQGCNVYGNQTSNSNTGIQLANSELPNKMADIFVVLGTLSLYKNNIGALVNRNGSSYTKAVYLKDVNFGANRLNVTENTINTFFQNTAGISGTIELVYNDASVASTKTTAYNAISPNLNFIVHGGSSTRAPKKGGNSLTIGSSGVIGNISTVYETDTNPAGDITISGVVNSITTAGKVILQSTAKVNSISDTANIGADLSNASIILNADIFEYTGSAIVPEIKVECNGIALVKDKNFTVEYSNNTEVGTATVTITGTGGCTGSVSKEFTIQQANMANLSVDLTENSFEYTGSAITPQVTVTQNGNQLKENVDYTIEYSNNIQAGTATVTITGKGNYTGTVSKTFTIKPAPVVTPSDTNNKKGGANMGLIIGLGIGGVVLLVGIGVLVWFIIKRKRDKQVRAEMYNKLRAKMDITKK